MLLQEACPQKWVPARLRGSTLNFSSNLHTDASLWLNPKLCIDKSPFFWKLWVRKGILILGDLYERGILKSFQDLKAQYLLPQSQFWKYLQLRHLLLQIFESPSTPPPTVSCLTYIRKVFGGGHEASKYYSVLLIGTDKGLPSLRSAWETDLSTSFTDQEWTMILQNSKKLSRELRTRLIQFKLLHRIYWSPQRLYRANIIQAPECWRCLSRVGTLTHMIWNCPKIQNFWTGVYEFIKSVIHVQQDIPFLPRLFILGDPSILKHFPSKLLNGCRLL